MLLAVVLGFVIGVVVGGLGGGGGVLAVPALVYLLGQSAQGATSSSLIIVGATALTGAVVRVRAGHVAWRTGLAFCVVGIPGAWAGTLLNKQAPEPVLLLAFAALTLLSATALLLNARRTTSDDPGPEPAATTTPGTVAVAAPPRLRRATLATAAKVVACGVLIGFLTGFLGVGGGFLVVPALVVVLGMPMNRAIGTSLMVITVNTLASLLSRVGGMEVDPAVVIPFTAAAILATFVGKLIADRLAGAVLARCFAFMLLAVGGFVAVESVLALV
jgi:uncharacterized membrane protein YfcA